MTVEPGGLDHLFVWIFLTHLLYFKFPGKQIPQPWAFYAKYLLSNALERWELGKGRRKAKLGKWSSWIATHFQQRLTASSVPETAMRIVSIETTESGLSVPRKTSHGCSLCPGRGQNIRWVSFPWLRIFLDRESSESHHYPSTTLAVGWMGAPTVRGILTAAQHLLLSFPQVVQIHTLHLLHSPLSRNRLSRTVTGALLEETYKMKRASRRIYSFTPSQCSSLEATICTHYLPSLPLVLDDSHSWLVPLLVLWLSGGWLRPSSLWAPSAMTFSGPSWYICLLSNLDWSVWSDVSLDHLGNQISFLPSLCNACSTSLGDQGQLHLQVWWFLPWLLESRHKEPKVTRLQKWLQV